jgi:restriction endonuclease
MNIDPFSLRPNEPFPLEEVFVGRRPEMQALASHFSDKKKRLAQITGARGTGKTMLALMYGRRADSTFPGGWQHIHAFPPQTIEDMILHAFPPPQHKRHLAILDDLDLAARDEINTIPTLLHRYPLLNLLLVGQEPSEIPQQDVLSIALSGVSQPDFQEILARRLDYARASRSEVEKLFASSQGNPLLAAAANQSVREGLATFQQFLNAFRDFDYSPILGPDGSPAESGLVVPSGIVESVTGVNEELLARLKADPELLRGLPPRKFEEVVAELLERQGYSIELTPASKDGGFDMYAAKNESLGQFLYLVECKRYTPPNNVGVQIVRGLHGVVQQKRANAGIIVTTAFFTKGAKEIHKELKHQLQLQDYVALQKWLGIV